MVRVWRSAPAIDQADGTGRVLRPADRDGRPVGAPVGGAVMGCGILPRWPACSSGSWLGAPVSGQLLGQTRLPKRIALPVFCRCSTTGTGSPGRPDRIAGDLYKHVIGWVRGRPGPARHPAKSPAVAARIANRIDQLDDVITEIRTAVFDLHTYPADTPRLGGVLHDIVQAITAGHRAAEGATTCRT